MSENRLDLTENEAAYLAAYRLFGMDYHRIDEWGVEKLGLGSATMEFLRRLALASVDEIQLSTARYLDELGVIQEERSRMLKAKNRNQKADV